MLFANLKRYLNIPSQIRFIKSFLPGYLDWYELLKSSKKRNKVWEEHPVVIGMPIVWRDNVEHQYFIITIKSLLQALTKQQKSVHKIVVFIAEKNIAKSKKIHTELQNNFSQDIYEKNLILLKKSEEAGYSLSQESSFKESATEQGSYIKWRSNVGLDAAFLIKNVFEQFHSHHFYLHLEDDIRTYPGKFNIDLLIHAKNKIEKERAKNWIAIKFFHGKSSQNTYRLGGFFGLLFHVSDLYDISNFIIKNHLEKPVDWILGDYILSKGSELYYVRKKLFDHLGEISSKDNV